MRKARKLATWGGASALLLLVWGSASTCAVVLVAGRAPALLIKDEQKCIDQYNNKLRLVGQTAGKDYRKCVKFDGKNKLLDKLGEATADDCVTSDAPDKIQGKKDKVDALFDPDGKCDLMPASPIQQGATTGNDAMVNSSQDLVHDLFGNPIGGTNAPGKDEAKCQDKAYQRAEQLFTEKLKGFRKCKKDGMKTGLVTDSATLAAACMSDPGPFGIPDPSGKIGKKAQKLLDDVDKACALLPLGTLFPGECAASASTAILGACIEQRVECRVCEALNTADGMSVNCDLFDDGIANGSCGIVLHTCALAPAPSSQILIYVAALPVPLVFGLSGTLDIGTAGPVATCDIQTINPFSIPAIGFVCISPASGCAKGVRWCGPGPGPALGIDIQSDGNAGACTSNTDCETIAASTCPVLFGLDYAPQTAQCTGFCSGTSPANQACSADADCLPANGACNGPNPVGVYGNVCQISCIKNDAPFFSFSDPGDLQCELGLDVSVEAGSPCDGTDTLLAVGQMCIPVSTQEASSLIGDANFIPGSFVPPPPNVNDLSGVPVACATLDMGATAGLRGVGAVNAFGSALGDLAIGIQATCQ